LHFLAHRILPRALCITQEYSAEPPMHSHRVFPSYCFSTAATCDRRCIMCHCTSQVSVKILLDESDTRRTGTGILMPVSPGMSFFLQSAFMFQNMYWTVRLACVIRFVPALTSGKIFCWDDPDALALWLSRWSIPWGRRRASPLTITPGV
jgi:hypothetical protein